MSLSALQDGMTTFTSDCGPDKRPILADDTRVIRVVVMLIHSDLAR